MANKILVVMITEDYCTEGLVKLLLEKGCPLDKVIKQDKRPVYFSLPTDHPNWADCDVYYIPTHAQIMKWLREKHNIIITPQPEYFSCDRCESWGIDIWAFDNYEKLPGDFPTYEEAVEAALKYVLEKLIQ